MDLFSRPWPPVNLSHGGLQTAHSCWKRYFLHTYWAWGAWHKGPTAAVNSRRLAYALKKGTSARATAGQVVHDAAANLATGTETTPAQAVAEFQQRMARTTPNSSKASKRKPLHLGDYYEAEADDNAAECEDIIRASLANLAIPEGQVMACEEMVQIPTPDGTVWIVADLVVGTVQGEYEDLIVIDWKTGKPRPEHESQLAIYADWAFSLPPLQEGLQRRVTTRAVYLATGEEREWHPTKQEAAQAMQQLTGWLVDELRQRVRGGDLEKNEPLFGEDYWPALPEGSAACGWCDYRRLCKRG